MGNNTSSNSDASLFPEGLTTNKTQEQNVRLFVATLSKEFNLAPVSPPVLSEMPAIEIETNGKTTHVPVQNGGDCGCGSSTCAKVPISEAVHIEFSQTTPLTANNSVASRQFGGAPSFNLSSTDDEESEEDQSDLKTEDLKKMNFESESEESEESDAALSAQVNKAMDRIKNKQNYDSEDNLIMNLSSSEKYTKRPSKKNNKYL